MAGIRGAGGRACVCLAIALAVSACKASSSFTPVSPDELATRMTDLLNGSQSSGMTLIANRTGEFTRFTVYQGETLNLAYVFDWTVAANNVTMALHRLGPAGELDEDQPPQDNCAIPPRFPPGAAIGANLGLPVCPTVPVQITGTKPFLFEIVDLPPGQYAMVVTNVGNVQTLRFAVTGY